jgi:hypothetical protein
MGVETMKEVMVCCVVCLLCHGTVASAAEDASDSIRGMLSGDFEVRLKARQRLRNERADIAKHLKTILQTDRSKKAEDVMSSPKHQAIVLAGLLRVEQCTGELFKELDFELEINTEGYGGMSSLVNRFPAAQSLIDLGTYAVVIESLDVLANSISTDHSKRLCAIILRSVVGAKKAEELVLAEIAKTNDAQRRTTLLDALNRLKATAEQKESTR